MVGGVNEVVFLPPAAWPPPADGSPWGGGVRDCSVSQPPSLPPVSPEAKKRGSATWTSSWVRVLLSPGGSFGRAGGGAGHRRTSPPTCFQQNKKAWPSPAPFLRWPRSCRVGPGLELGERVRSPAVLTHCLFLYRTSSLRLTS